MSNHTAAPAVSIPSTVPAPKDVKRPIWKRPITLVGTGMLVAGLLIGGSGKPEAPAPVEVEKVVTKEVKVEVTPAVCLSALDLSETAFGYASEALGYTSAALTAAGNMDIAGINAASADLKVLNPKITAIAPRVNAAKAECRAAG